eukprot:Rmarinus@m.13411
MKKVILLSALSVAGVFSLPIAEVPNLSAPVDFEARLSQYAPAELTADLNEDINKDVLRILFHACERLNDLFLKQTWSGALELKSKLSQDKSAEGQILYDYFNVNMGPWDDLDGGKSFVDDPSVPVKQPLGANYYPEDASKEELTDFFDSINDSAATGFFSVVKRNDDGSLAVHPFSEAYAEELVDIAMMLNQAAKLTDDPTLSTFLEKRAESLLSDDYYDSDLAWLALDGSLDVTFGPYETYMDKVFGYKAAFEGAVTVVNADETSKLSVLADHLQDLEDNLPEPDEFKRQLGDGSIIRVVDTIYQGGDLMQGVQTAAFNLPNDERVIQHVGSKRVMLRNVQEAKFEKTLVPISEVVVAGPQQDYIGFGAFFQHVLLHELAHGLGPAEIEVDGRKTTVREELQELNSALEEAKADIVGLFGLQFYLDTGVIDAASVGSEEHMYCTYMASAFRTMRFGIGEAHGQGQALQFNWILEKGGFYYDDVSGAFAVDFAKVKGAVESLANRILTIQARGDKDAAKALLDKYAVLTPEISSLLHALESVPVDIRPSFPLTAELDNPAAAFAPVSLTESDLEKAGELLEGVLYGFAEREAPKTAACLNGARDIASDVLQAVAALHDGEARTGVLLLADALRVLLTQETSSCAAAVKMELPDLELRLASPEILATHATTYLLSHFMQVRTDVVTAYEDFEADRVYESGVVIGSLLGEVLLG